MILKIYKLKLIKTKYKLKILNINMKIKYNK